MTRRRWISIATLVVIAAICIGPFSSWLLHNEIERLIGVSTQIDSLSIKRSNKAWLARKFSLARIDNPTSPILQTERTWFKLSWKSLLTRRLYFTEVIVENALIPTPPDRLPQVDLTVGTDDDSAILSAQIFREPSETNWDTLLKDLQIEDASKKLENNWAMNLSAVEAKVADIEQSISKMRSYARALDNPLRDVQTLQDSTRRAKQMRDELPSLENNINELSQSRMNDKSLMEQAMAHDKVLIEKRVKDCTAQCRTVADAFVKSLISKQVETLKTYGDLGSTAVSLADFTFARSQRGRDFFVHDAQSIPTWQIDRTLILGSVLIDGQQQLVRGRLDHLVAEKTITARPTTAQFKITREDNDVVVQASRLKSMTHPIETVDIKNVDKPNSSWRVALPDLQLNGVGGKMSTWINWERDDEDWKCNVSFHNKGVCLTVSASDAVVDQDLIDRMNASLTSTYDLEVTGTILVDANGQSHGELKSNLAQALESAFTVAFSESMSAHQTAINAKYQSLYGERFETLASKKGEQDKMVLERIKKLNQDIDEFSTEVTARIDPRNDNRFSRMPTPNRIAR